ncbi:MAG: hypothetical protein CMP10_08860 [Zetaproteobacteria bacterium]|nr:hypothetical protein [Pseudobdellovibrionaceae bacterium]
MNAYFNELNYSLANEDTSLEVNVLPDQSKHVLVAAGSGSRVTPLLAKNPEHITVVDLAKQQLYLTQLRVETIRNFQRDEFLSFWGYPSREMNPETRKKYFMELNLEAEAKEYFINLFDSHNWQGIVYNGKWEKTFNFISRVFQLLIGKNKIDQLFQCRNMEEQQQYLQSNFYGLGYRLTVGLLGNAKFFNTFLYKGHFVKKNMPIGYYDFYNSTFRKVLSLCPARENYFINLILRGTLDFPEGLPIECDEDVFHKTKQALNTTTISYELGNILDVAQKVPPIDLISFSDVPSYFSGDIEKSYLQKIRPYIAADGLVTLRYYLRIPENTDKNGFDDVTSDYATAIAKEKTQSYNIEILKKIA